MSYPRRLEPSSEMLPCHESRRQHVDSHAVYVFSWIVLTFVCICIHYYAFTSSSQKTYIFKLLSLSLSLVFCGFLLELWWKLMQYVYLPKFCSDVNIVGASKILIHEIVLCQLGKKKIINTNKCYTYEFIFQSHHYKSPGILY